MSLDLAQQLPPHGTGRPVRASLGQRNSTRVCAPKIPRTSKIVDGVVPQISTSARPALPELKSSVRRLRAALAELSYEDLAVVTRVSGYCFGRVYSTQSMRAPRLSGCLHVVRYPEITARHAGWHWQQGAESRAHGLHDHRVRRSGRRIAVRWFRSIQCKTPSDTDVRRASPSPSFLRLWLGEGAVAAGVCSA